MELSEWDIEALMAPVRPQNAAISWRPPSWGISFARRFGIPPECLTMSRNEQRDTTNIVEKPEDRRPPALLKDDSSPNVPHTKQEENIERKSKKGQVAGGSFLKESSRK